jgi:putative ABC transport system ATP-binding protein
MDTPSEGSIMLEGQDLTKLSDRKLTNMRLNHIGFIFQTFNLMSTLSALENVMLPITLNGESKKAAREKALDLLEMVGLKDRVRHVPAKMSGGQRQRVAIARALANDPAIILADEPTGNLDSVSGENVMELLYELNRKGHTIIMVTHNNEIAEKVDRVIRMKDGKVS